jgi:hypothetical protein
MANITVDDLINLGPLNEQSANSWADFLAGVEQNATYLQKNVTAKLGEAWTGTAAQLAKGKISASHDGLIASATCLANIQQALETFASGVGLYAVQMQLEVPKVYKGMVIEPDGTVYVPAGTSINGLTHAQATAEAETFTANIKKILADANAFDQETADIVQANLPGSAIFATPTTASSDPKPQPVSVQSWSATVTTEGSLWEIAEYVYGPGNGDKWQLIYDANKKTIGSNPNLIFKGMKLTIPPLAGSAGSPSGVSNGNVTGTAPVKVPSSSSQTTSFPQPITYEGKTYVYYLDKGGYFDESTGKYLWPKTHTVSYFPPPLGEAT